MTKFNYIIVHPSKDSKIELVQCDFDLRKGSEADDSILRKTLQFERVNPNAQYHEFICNSSSKMMVTCYNEENPDSRPSNINYFDTAKEGSIFGGRFSFFHAEYKPRHGKIVIVKQELNEFTDKEFIEVQKYVQEEIDCMNRLKTKKQKYPVQFYMDQLKTIIQIHYPFILFIVFFTLFVFVY